MNNIEKKKQQQQVKKIRSVFFYVVLCDSRRLAGNGLLASHDILTSRNAAEAKIQLST